MNKSSFGLLPLCLLACGMPQEGRLYRLDSGGVTRFRVANAWSGSSDVEAELTDGTACRGRLSRTGHGAPVFDPATELPLLDRGVAVLVCPAKAVLKCEIVHRLEGDYAFGECHDQNGAKYTVVF
jgi:hypothetical protein